MFLPLHMISSANFKTVLYPVHKTYWKKAEQKLRRKISALRSSLKKRSEDSDVEFKITSHQIQQMFYDIYGSDCKYCNKQLNIRTIACDHIIPLSKGGPSIKENLQLICRTCNTRKGPLDEENFQYIMKWVDGQEEEEENYLMRKLAKGGRY